MLVRLAVLRRPPDAVRRGSEQVAHESREPRPCRIRHDRAIGTDERFGDLTPNELARLLFEVAEELEVGGRRERAAPHLCPRIAEKTEPLLLRELAEPARGELGHFVALERQAVVADLARVRVIEARAM